MICKILDTILFCVCGYIKPDRQIVSYLDELERAIRDLHNALPGNRYWGEQYRRVKIVRHFFQSGKGCG